MAEKIKLNGSKRLRLLERLDYIRMNAEALDFQDLQVIRDEITRMLEA